MSWAPHWVLEFMNSNGVKQARALLCSVLMSHNVTNSGQHWGTSVEHALVLLHTPLTHSLSLPQAIFNIDSLLLLKLYFPSFAVEDDNPSTSCFE